MPLPAASLYPPLNSPSYAQNNNFHKQLIKNYKIKDNFSIIVKNNFFRNLFPTNKQKIYSENILYNITTEFHL